MEDCVKKGLDKSKNKVYTYKQAELNYANSSVNSKSNELAEGLNEIGGGLSGILESLDDAIKAFSKLSIFKLAEAICKIAKSVNKFCSGIRKVIGNIKGFGDMMKECVSIQNVFVTLYSIYMFPNRLTYEGKDFNGKEFLKANEDDSQPEMFKGAIFCL